LQQDNARAEASAILFLHRAEPLSQTMSNYLLSLNFIPGQKSKNPD